VVILTAASKIGAVTTPAQRLSELDPVLRDVLEGFVSRIGTQPGVCVALSGSVARGEADRYSDLDIWVLIDREEQFADVREAAQTFLAEIGEPITSFAATHLGAENLLIFFLERDGQIVKVDVEVVLAKGFQRPSELLALHDPNAIVDRLDERAPAIFDIEEANRRVAGWIWYAYTKAARGELFEAVDALDVLRKLALVPLLLRQAGASIEGYRRLERKLTPDALKRLRETYPSEISAPAIVAALTHAGRTFCDVYALVAEPTRAQTGARRIERILAAIERSPPLPR
jgi:predicted nucleotidyltransferase